ncbi:TPA: redoxin domain-containing protein [Candidatus Woesearchaeota archaeon]|nr:redoxin domain-containing protein [Candidatus Woesearchaeota archaeon]
MANIGEKAPDFTLANEEGKEVKFSSLFGKQKILLYFYPLDWSPVCSVQHKDFCAEYDKFEEADAQIVAVSTDHKFSHAAFKLNLGAKYILLSDPEKKAIKAYGVDFEGKQHSKRAYFIINKQGIVRWKHVEESTGNKRSNDELLEALKNIK